MAEPVMQLHFMVTNLKAGKPWVLNEKGSNKSRTCTNQRYQGHELGVFNTDLYILQNYQLL